MNAREVMRYGHQTMLRAVDGIPEEAATDGRVVGNWTARDVVAHIASFERVLAEILEALVDAGAETPTLDRFRSDPEFNDRQVAMRSDRSLAEVLDEYETSHARVMELLDRLPPHTLDREGILPWYGKDYDLDDFIVYTFYGHKREHGSQLALFKKRLEESR